MARLILIRHGQTLWNSSGKYQGHTDIPLNSDGIKQAQKVAERLCNEKISAIYSSDLERAKETAEIISHKYNLPVNLNIDLREINFGDWEGKTFKEINDYYPELLKVWLANPEKLIIPNGETFVQLKTRAIREIDKIVSLHENETIIVVSHGGTIATIICGILNIELNKLWQIKINNSSINIIEFYNGKGIITLLNDTNHLEDRN